MNPILLQADFCTTGTSGFEYLLDFEFIKAFACTFADSVGLLTTGLLFYGGISLAIYIRTGTPVIPLILLLLIGGAVMSQVASVGVAIASVLLLVGSAGVFAYAYLRYSR